MNGEGWNKRKRTLIDEETAKLLTLRTVFLEGVLTTLRKRNGGRGGGQMMEGWKQPSGAWGLAGGQLGKQSGKKKGGRHTDADTVTDVVRELW